MTAFKYLGAENARHCTEVRCKPGRGDLQQVRRIPGIVDFPQQYHILASHHIQAQRLLRIQIPHHNPLYGCLQHQVGELVKRSAGLAVRKVTGEACKCNIVSTLTGRTILICDAHAFGIAPGCSEKCAWNQ